MAFLQANAICESDKASSHGALLVMVAIAIAIMIATVAPIVVAIVVAVVAVSASAVPAMIVPGLPSIAFPITRYVMITIVTRRLPACPQVWRTGPVAVVPPVAVSHRIPVTRYPGIIGTGTSRLNSQYTDRRRRAYSYPDGNLSEDGSRCQ